MTYYDISKRSVLDHLKSLHDAAVKRRDMGYRETKIKEENVPTYRHGIEVDCHGGDLTWCLISEYVCYVAHCFGASRVDFITGQGLHSEGTQSILKPAFLTVPRLFGYNTYVNPHNSGIVSVDVTKRAIFEGNSHSNDINVYIEGNSDVKKSLHDSNLLSYLHKKLSDNPVRFVNFEDYYNRWFTTRILMHSQLISNAVKRKQRTTVDEHKIVEFALRVNHGSKALSSERTIGNVKGAIAKAASVHNIMNWSERAPNVIWQMIAAENGLSALDKLGDKQTSNIDQEMVIENAIGVCDAQIPLKGSRYGGEDRTEFFIEMETYGVKPERIREELAMIDNKHREFKSKRKSQYVLEIRIFGDSKETLSWLENNVFHTHDKYRILPTDRAWLYTIRYQPPSEPISRTMTWSGTV